MWVTKKTPLPVFEQCNGGNQAESVGDKKRPLPASVLGEGGDWWQAESVGDEKRPLCHLKHGQRGLVAGRRCG
jgi:hypothetical protein